MDPIALTVSIVQGRLAGVPVSTEVPMDRDRPSRLAVVTLEGMQDDGFLMLARMGITCWGVDDRDAFGMAMAAADALRDAALDHQFLSSADVDAMARDEWTATGQARYYVAVSLVINTDETD